MMYKNTKLADTFSEAFEVMRDHENRVYLDNDYEGFKLLLDFLNYPF